MNELQEEHKTLTILSSNYEEQRQIYLSRPNADKSWNADIERHLAGLTAQQKAEVLRAANESHLNLTDMSAQIALLALSSRAVDTSSMGVKVALASFQARLEDIERHEAKTYDLAVRRLGEVNGQLKDVLSAVLQRADETLALVDERTTEAVEKLKGKLAPESIAAEATAQARKHATKIIFKELGDGLKSYIKTEVEAEIHRKTTLLNVMWVVAVVLVGCVGFWAGRH